MGYLIYLMLRKMMDISQKEVLTVDSSSKTILINYK